MENQKPLNKSQRLKYVAGALLVGLLAVGGYKYHLKNTYVAGTCLIDRESKFPFKIVQVTEEEYILELDFGIAVGRVGIPKSELTPKVAQRVDCQTGAPLEL